MRLQTFLAITEGWRVTFTQRRLHRQQQALGTLLVLGRATLSRILWTNGREQCSWAADYFLQPRVSGIPDLFGDPIRHLSTNLILGFCCRSGAVIELGGGQHADRSNYRKTETQSQR